MEGARGRLGEARIAEQWRSGAKTLGTVRTDVEGRIDRMRGMHLEAREGGSRVLEASP